MKTTEQTAGNKRRWDLIRCASIRSPASHVFFAANVIFHRTPQRFLGLIFGRDGLYQTDEQIVEPQIVQVYVEFKAEILSVS
jgi:hypothetical protein